MSMELAFLLSACLIRHEACFTAADDVTVWQSVQYAHPPKFTELARRARVTGEVVVEVHVEPTGEVSSTVLVGKGLPTGLDKASLEAAKQWIFEPSRQQHKRELIFEFSIAQECDPAPQPVERLGAHRLRIWHQQPRIPSSHGRVLEPCPP